MSTATKTVAKAKPKEKFRSPFSNREFKRLLATTSCPFARQVVKGWQYGTEPKKANKGSFRWEPGRGRKPDEVMEEAKKYHRSR